MLFRSADAARRIRDAVDQDVRDRQASTTTSATGDRIAALVAR